MPQLPCRILNWLPDRICRPETRLHCRQRTKLPLVLTETSYIVLGFDTSWIFLPIFQLLSGLFKLVDNDDIGPGDNHHLNSIEEKLYLIYIKNIVQCKGLKQITINI